MLYKLFSAQAGPKRFDTGDRFDVFRKLAGFCVQLLAEAERDMSINEHLLPFVAFVRQPIKAVVYQRVGNGVPYDIFVDGKPYVLINGDPKPYGYEFLFDLREAYRLGRIVVVPRTKDIFIPGTEQVCDGCLVGETIDGDSIGVPLRETWVVPKLMFCMTKDLRRIYPFYGAGT